MAKKHVQNQDNRKQEGGGSSTRKAGLLIYVPALCNVIGTLMLLVVIAAAVPLTIPNFLGYEVYNVVSGSMEPTIPIGSIIYVKEIEPAEINSGDIIAFRGGDSIIMHRVVTNKVVEGTFVTKGDANEGEDMNDVPYDHLVGIVVRHIPILGQLLTLFGSTFGRICMVCFAACGALLNILGSRFRDALEYEREIEREREKLLAEAAKKKGGADECG
jgi:signal peptidase I